MLVSSSDILKFWEPRAPSFENRFKSLKYAYKLGFKTSVSCEPMLDCQIEKLINKILPYITETIWIGNANFLIKRLKTNGVSDLETLQKANELVTWQSNKENILKLFNLYILQINVASIIAEPIGWYVMHGWLKNLACKAGLSWWIFILTGIIALTIALLTVTWQSWKAATNNPVESLRFE